jgi:amino-acid N-acetyltransferase
MHAVGIKPYTAHDEPALLELLEVAELPSEDLTPAMLEDFLVAHLDGRLVGTAGLEHYEDVGLLRSVAVEEAHRGTGLGKRLVEAMEEQAREAGVRDLYVLTTTAERFFAGLGYKTAAREQAPEAIKATEQFSKLCPSSSTFMVKSLIPAA